MELWRALLLGALAGFGMLDQFGPHLGFRKPLLIGTVAGIIMGDFTQGIIIAGTLELMWLGTNNVGTYQPPDVISGTVVGVAIGIATGEGIGTAVAVAIPTAMLVQQLQMVVMTANSWTIAGASKAVESGSFGVADKWQYLGGTFYFLSRAIPTFIMVFFGAPAIDLILNTVPQWVIDGLTVASGLLPAVGLALLLSMMMGKNMWVFMLLGYVLSAYLGLDVIGVTLIAVVFAFIYDMIIQTANENTNNNNQSDKTSIEEEYDL